MATATELWNYRGLIGNLAQREMKAQYKKSVLGSLWSLINPASTLLIYTLVFGVFLRIEPPVAGNGETKVFALYLFAALIVWNFFAGIVNGSMIALNSAGGLLKKVYFPPECPAIANVLSVLVQTGIESAILVVVMIVVGNASWTFLLFPFVLIFLVPFCLGVGLVVSLANVYFRDIGYLVGIGMNLLFYCTPIIYPFSIVPEKVGPIPARTLISLNPLTQFTELSRDLMYGLTVPSWRVFVFIPIVSLVTFFGGWKIFSKFAVDVGEEL